MGFPLIASKSNYLAQQAVFRTSFVALKRCPGLGQATFRAGMSLSLHPITCVETLKSSRLKINFSSPEKLILGLHVFVLGASHKAWRSSFWESLKRGWKYNFLSHENCVWNHIFGRYFSRKLKCIRTLLDWQEANTKLPDVSAKTSPSLIGGLLAPTQYQILNS